MQSGVYFLVSSLNLDFLIQAGYRSFATPYLNVKKDLEKIADKLDLKIYYRNIDIVNAYDFKIEDKIIKELYQNYLPMIANRLNLIHQKAESLLYWERIIGFQLLQHISFCRSMYRAIQECLRDSYSIQILDSSNYVTPVNFEDYRKLVQYSQHGTEQLFSIYFTSFSSQKHNSFLHVVNRLSKEKKVNYLSFLNLRGLSKIFDILARKALGFLQDSHKVQMLIIESFFEPKYLNKLLQQNSEKIGFNSFRVPTFENVKVDVQKRKKVFASNSSSTFDLYFFKTLESFAPFSWIENYENLKNSSKDFLTKYKTLSVIVNESLSEHTAFIVSEASKKGVKHVYNEHNYLQYFFVGNNLWHTLRKVDYFLTLGWESKEYSKALKSGSLYKWSDKESYPFLIDVLFISGLAQHHKGYHSGGYGESGSAAADSYFRMNLNFFDSLSTDVIKKVYYKGYPSTSDYFGSGFFSENLYLKKYLSEFKSFDFSSKYLTTRLINSSKLVVVNYLSTPYIQALISNRPTIVIFNSEHYFLIDGYSNIFDDLLEAGIFYTNSELAAKFINTNISKINDWWFSDKTQKARVKFINQNIGTSQNLIHDLLKHIK